MSAVPRVLLTRGDIVAIETAAEALMRSGDTGNAIALFSIALRLRTDLGWDLVDDE